MPDIVCLQETRVDGAKAEAMLRWCAARGWEASLANAIVTGEGPCCTSAGVAVLGRKHLPQLD
eukprot:12922228-Prorocentrum_lima.AAC.1